jgi:hypothetical protein
VNVNPNAVVFVGLAACIGALLGHTILALTIALSVLLVLAVVR